MQSCNSSHRTQTIPMIDEELDVTMDLNTTTKIREQSAEPSSDELQLELLMMICNFSVCQIWLRIFVSVSNKLNTCF